MFLFVLEFYTKVMRQKDTYVHDYTNFPQIDQVLVGLFWVHNHAIETAFYPQMYKVTQAKVEEDII